MSKAAAAHATLPVTAELLERLQYFRLEPKLIVDLGCGTGAGAAALRRRFPRARVIGIDLSHEMTRQARRAQRFWRRYDCLCADACALPLATQSVDLVFSSLMLQHCDDPAFPFAEVQRVLRPGGLLLFCTLGPGTLHELREGGDGAALAGRRRTLTGPARWRQMLGHYETLRSSAGIPASWELIYGAAFAGATRHSRAPGASSRAKGETVVPLDTLRTRGRSRP